MDARDPLSLLADGLEAVAASVRALAASRPDDWVDQGRSPLGRRTHCRLARKGVLKGKKVGALWLVRRRDLDAFIEGHVVVAKGAASGERADAEVALQRAMQRPSRRRKRSA